MAPRSKNAEEVTQVVEASPANDFLDRWAAGNRKQRCPPVRAS